MVRKGGKRKTPRRSCTPKGSKTKYKKCLVAAVRKAKISTPKSAQRAFRAAVKKCRPILSGKAPSKRRGGKKKRKTTRRFRRSMLGGRIIG